MGEGLRRTLFSVKTLAGGRGHPPLLYILYIINKLLGRNPGKAAGMWSGCVGGGASGTPAPTEGSFVHPGAH